MAETDQLVIAFQSDVPSILSQLEEARYNTDILSLRFQEIELGGKVFASAAHLLKSGRRWEHVEFSDCSNPTTVSMIISIAMIIANVKSLQYGAYRLEDNVMLALSAALQANAPTQSLRLDTEITLSAANSISTGISENTQILTLDLSGCEFTNVDCLAALCKGLANNSTIRTLRLSGCGLDDHLVTVLIRRGLVNHSALSELWLDGNYCRNKGLAAVAEMLQVETNKLATLSLNSQGFESGDEQFDLSILAAALKTNVTLKYLDLSNNCTILGTDRLLDPSIVKVMLKTNKTLAVLDLSNNCLDNEDLKQIIEGLKANSAMEAIQLGSNNITEDGLTNFLDNLEGMKGLKRVGFSGNLLEEYGIRMLYESFPESVSTDF
jgi:hypothetical protein